MYLWSWRKVLFSQSNYVTFFTSNCFAVLCFVTQSCPTLCNSMDCCPWGSSGQGILQTRTLEWFAMPCSRGTFQLQGSNPGLSYCKRILYCLSHRGSPRILEWVAYPFSRGSSCPRNQTWVLCIAGGLLTIWATREAPLCFISACIILYSIYFTHLFLFFYDNISSKKEGYFFLPHLCSQLLTQHLYPISVCWIKVKSSLSYKGRTLLIFFIADNCFSVKIH